MLLANCLLMGGCSPWTFPLSSPQLLDHVAKSTQFIRRLIINLLDTSATIVSAYIESYITLRVLYLLFHDMMFSLTWCRCYVDLGVDMILVNARMGLNNTYLNVDMMQTDLGADRFDGKMQHLMLSFANRYFFDPFEMEMVFMYSFY